MATGDLNPYKPVSYQLGLAASLRGASAQGPGQPAAHNSWRERDKALIWEVVPTLPRDGGDRLLRLERRVRRAPLRRLVVDLIGQWPALVYHQGQRLVPATNNRTELAIGKSKVRFRTVRGFKRVAGALSSIALTQWVYSGGGDTRFEGAGRLSRNAPGEEVDRQFRNSPPTEIKLRCAQSY